MRREAFDREHTVIYEDDGVEITRYSVTAATELEAELETSPMFFREHPRFDQFALNPGLTFRIESATARPS